MNTTRDETLFCLRYAVRVLERQARFWGLVATAFKFAAILSGTGALAALTGTNTKLAITLGVLFAVFQAIEIALDPGGKHGAALAARKDYARLLAAQARHDDNALENAYQAIVADDEVIVIAGLRDLAYNDVAREQGRVVNAPVATRRWLDALS